jgi:hypothetical protein
MSLGAAVEAAVRGFAEDLRDALTLRKVYTVYPKTVRTADLPYAVLSWRVEANEDWATVSVDGYRLEVTATILEKETPQMDWLAGATAWLEAVRAVLSVPEYHGLREVRVIGFTVLEADEEPVVGVQLTWEGFLAAERA